ncbi:metal ABC transporter substrate-binding protein [Candidatus Nitrotoga sp. AM1P]|uniref:metal ABC transporter substrate-binding protein n=1 Tax=Candidatus Nitrotoga sp. AM1P TaxID=2559597 RepID=UPI0010B3CD1D|nr:zinc ABC transporter substrate-binding protein [Candidatus Nitrotoga sp. AM1P]BBJ24705.1 Zinc ABC transporter substrate-binding protein [Candidatus Nitrotoga sp. AM1P]
MKKIFFPLMYLLLAALIKPVHAALEVLACEPEWAALTKELAANKANIYTATNALQDPHYVEARPGLISRARRAQLVVCTGAELELAWLPLMLRESGNVNAVPGKPGYFNAASYVTMLEIPVSLDRALGDLHALGNPHIHLDARNFLPIAKALSERLVELDPANTAFYVSRLQAFTQTWQTAITRWEKQAAPLKGQPFVAQHQAYSYMNIWLGLKQVAVLEPKPGMEPSVSHLSKVIVQLQQSPAKMVVRSAYQNPKPSKWIAERAHIPEVVLPFSVGGSDGSKDLFGLFDDTIARLLAGISSS